MLLTHTRHVVLVWQWMVRPALFAVEVLDFGDMLRDDDLANMR